MLERFCYIGQKANNVKPEEDWISNTITAEVSTDDINLIRTALWCTPANQTITYYKIIFCIHQPYLSTLCMERWLNDEINNWFFDRCNSQDKSILCLNSNTFVVVQQLMKEPKNDVAN